MCFEVLELALVRQPAIRMPPKGHHPTVETGLQAVRRRFRQELLRRFDK